MQQPSSVFASQASTSSDGQEQVQPPQFNTSLLPENNIVDLNSLASEKKKDKAGASAERRTLNDLQKAKASTESQPTPVMAVPPQMHAAGGAVGGGAMVPTGMGMMMNPMMANGNMMPNNGSMLPGQMMMTPQMQQAQWMQQQQQQQQYAMSGMMHPQAAAAYGNFQAGGAQPQQQTTAGAGFQFQQQQQ